MNNFRADIYGYLDAAIKENGYTEMLEWTDEEILGDMQHKISASAECALLTYPEDALIFIADWREING